MKESKQLGSFLTEYTERNVNNEFVPVAVGRFGIRTRESIYSKELAKDYSKNKLIHANTLTVGMGSVQIDIGVLTDDVTYSVSPAYHTYRINGINGDYLRYCLECRNADMFARYVKRGSRQGKTIDLKRWLTYEIPVYSSDEQKEIVDCLDAATRTIATQKEQLVKLDELVKSRFIEMFGDLIINDKGWTFVKLSSVCDVRDGTHDTPKYQDEGFPLLTSKNFSQGFVDFEDCGLISKEDFDAINRRSKVDFGDIIMPMIGTIGHPVIVDTEKEFAIKNVALIKMGQSSFDSIFLKALLESDFFDKTVADNNRGVNQKFLSLGMIRRIKVPSVPTSLQQEFAAFVQQVDKLKAAVQQAIDKLELLKASLMQEYFSV